MNPSGIIFLFSINPHLHSNRRNLNKPRRYESKVRAALDRIVDQSMRAFNPGANSIDDQSFHSILHPTNRLNIPDENQPSRDIVLFFCQKFLTIPSCRVLQLIRNCLLSSLSLLKRDLRIM